MTDKRRGVAAGAKKPVERERGINLDVPGAALQDLSHLEIMPKGSYL